MDCRGCIKREDWETLVYLWPHKALKAEDSYLERTGFTSIAVRRQKEQSSFHFQRCRRSLHLG